MNPFLLLLCLLLCLPATSSRAQSTIWRERADSVLRVLDTEIDKAETYADVKRRRTAVLKELLARRRAPRDRYAACLDLYDEYLHFQYDSAFVYARRALTLATALGDEGETHAARCRLMDCYTNGGYFKEAYEVMMTTDTTALDSSSARLFWVSASFLYQNMYIYVQGTPGLTEDYERAQHRCYVRAYGKPNDSVGKVGGYMRDSRSVDPADLARRISGVPRLRQPSHDAAVALYVIGEMCSRTGRHDEAVYYTALSAINDIRSATRETAATRLLAGLLFDDGRVERAIRYIHKAEDDARFYHSRLRLVEIGDVLPAIESRYYDMQRRQRTLWAVAAALALLLATAAVLFAVKLHRSHRRLAEMSRKSHERGERLAEANTALTELNAQLEEAGRVKYQFIVQSLYSDSAFADRVEEKAKAVAVKVRAKQYADILRLLQEMDVRGERERMSAVFDQTFLRLYPTFVDDYNRLFPPDRQSTLSPSGAMPTEMRIFALLRLGISDTKQVGRYLNLTQNSIYVYRAKAKAAATVDKDAFDDRIMQIGL